MDAARANILANLQASGDRTMFASNMSDDGAASDCASDEDMGGQVRPMSYAELTDVQFKEDCFACKYINTQSLRENETFRLLMKLYTENAGSMSHGALFQQIKSYYDSYCRPMVQLEWTLPCIEEHFCKHTQFPTDEIIKQLRVLRAIRDEMISTALLRNARNNEITPLNNNIKNIVVIQKEIRELMQSKKKINTMLGYSEILDF